MDKKIILVILVMIMLGSCQTKTDNPSSQSIKDEAMLKEEEKMTIIMEVDDKAFTIELANTTAAKELAARLQKEDIIINMQDFGGFEKVGELGMKLTADDEEITTQAGDIMLYQADKIVIFYGSNSWSYTRIGSVIDITGLKEAFANSQVDVTLTLR